ncbi:hypothetical protein CEY00_Acc27951 [Actinidia chinensis var. chinensis]|uniref:DUF7610 domain-containing protein n=1 Tax=Actinidia chinensis var. chinensis TaxID=1590841 RepID=A0A2R6PLY3_ACTCC|nr:hypothetical protein CEY00_Acc27951 [Actinidia chinensis var. chinensis]
MTKRYAVLQKKLEELESSLALVFSLSPETTACHHLLSDDFHKRFLFLTNLLQAEIASHPSKPRHLAHIAHRLTQLESAFCDWDLHLTDSNHLDAVSTFSFTESCLDEDG